jgi:hypothetical protein
MELDDLANALNALSSSQWRDAALSALREPGFAFAGRSGAKETSTAQQLAELYQFRLEHTRKHGVDVIGIEDFLAALRQRPAGNRIRGESYQGTVSTVYAFWDEDNELVSCLTAHNTDSGEKAFQLAMGN